jgi:hypothetical protein
MLRELGIWLMVIGITGVIACMIAWYFIETNVEKKELHDWWNDNLP